MSPFKPLMLSLLALTSSVRADAAELEPLGSATIVVGGESTTWPVWQCNRMMLAHQAADADLTEAPHLKLIDYGDVIQLVLALEGRSYLADVPGSFDIGDIDYQGSATSINPQTMASAGEASFSLKLQCAD